MGVTKSSITISLLNTRSLKKIMDIVMDKHLLDNNIFCLTETQVETNDDSLPIESALQRQYRIHFNTNVNKFRSIAYGYSNQITILLNENSDAISIFIFRIFILFYFYFLAILLFQLHQYIDCQIHHFMCLLILYDI